MHEGREETAVYTGWHFTATATEGRDGWPLKAVEELPKGTKPVLCKVGLHACENPLDALRYAPGSFVRRVELRGTVLADGDKACGTERVTLAGPVDASRVLREFACACAERALLREREVGREPDPRSWAAIEVARRYARGEATVEELATARSAAWAAAVGSAAWAWSAAASAAAEREWQEAELTRRLRELLGTEQ